MSLYILSSPFSGNVRRDLYKICPDPGMSVDERSGQILWSDASNLSVLSTVGCDLVSNLFWRPEWIGVRGEAPEFSVSAEPGHLLSDLGGYTVSR